MDSASSRRRLWVLVVLLQVNPAMAKVQLATAGVPMENCAQSSAVMPVASGGMDHHSHHAAATAQMDQAAAAVPEQQDCCGQVGCGDCSMGSSGLLQRLPVQLSIHTHFTRSFSSARTVEALPSRLFRPPISA